MRHVVDEFDLHTDLWILERLLLQFVNVEENVLSRVRETDGTDRAWNLTLGRGLNKVIKFCLRSGPPKFRLHRYTTHTHPFVADEPELGRFGGEPGRLLEVPASGAERVNSTAGTPILSGR